MKIRLLTERTLVNILVLLCLGASGYAIHLATDFSQTFDVDDWPFLSIDDEPLSLIYLKESVALTVAFLPAMTITTLHFVVPVMLRALIRLEHYSAAFEMKFNLMRTVVLRMTSLLVLILTLYSCLATSAVSSCSMCWESRVGQQLYRLCIFDAAMTLSVTLLFKFPMTLILRRSLSPSGRMRCIGYPEFDVVANVLDLIYNQSICWLGMFYCPMLPVVTVLKLIVVFYVKYFSLSVFCLPPSLLHSAASTTNLFMNVSLLSFLSCLLPLGYHFVYLAPSSACGPFRTFNTVWSVVSQEVTFLFQVFRQFPSIASSLRFQN